MSKWNNLFLIVIIIFSWLPFKFQQILWYISINLPLILLWWLHVDKSVFINFLHGICLSQKKLCKTFCFVHYWNGICLLLNMHINLADKAKLSDFHMNEMMENALHNLKCKFWFLKASFTLVMNQFRVQVNI